MTDLRSALQTTLGSAYILDRELGGGGMSRVFVAEEAALGRKVVVKVLPPDVTAGVNVERFRREIQVSAKLQHAHIIPVLSTGEMNGVPYYVMPFVDGESLRARLVRTGALSITEAVSVLRDVAKALAYAHDHGVAHRDIKPDNILLSGGSATVADFGIAKAVSAARTQGHQETITQVGTSLGTPAYMAPEQAAADPATNHRADIYAFGCVAYEVLAGRPPFAGKTPQRLLAAQMGEKPQPVIETRADTPAELADLVMKCLEKDADNRPQSASDLVRVLETVTSGGGHTAMPPILMGGPGMLRRALMLYVAAFVVVMVLARAAIVGIGLPAWVLPGAAIVMLMGLPIILFTGYVQRVTRRAVTMTPTFTPGGTPSMSHGTMANLALKASPHMSWGRAARGGVYAVSAFILIIGAFMLLRSLGIGPAGSLLARGVLEDRDQVIVADFRVRGADSSLVDVIGEAVRSDLSQSNVINVVQPTAIASAIRLMQRPPGARLDSALARAVATRLGAKAIIDGNVTPLGNGFVVQMRMRSTDSLTELASFRETAETATDLIAVLGKLGRQLRGRVGESLRRVNKSPPLEAVTTGSLEALRKYAEGSRLVGSGEEDRGIALLREAIALDPGFAMAYRKLGVALNNAGMPRDSVFAAITKAHELRDRLTARERYLATAYYYNSGPGRDRAKGAAAYEALLKEYPDDYTALNNLGLIYEDRRDPVRGEAMFRRGTANPQATPVIYTNLAGSLENLGRIDEAHKVLAEGQKRFPTSMVLDASGYSLAYYQGDDSVRARLERMRASTNPRMRAGGHWASADDALRRGKLRESWRLTKVARELDAERGVPERPLEDSLWAAIEDSWYRNQPERSVQRVDRALALYPLSGMPLLDRPYQYVAIAYARAGKPDRARAIIAQEDAEVRDTAVKRSRRNDRDFVLAEIALAEGRPLEAGEKFRAADTKPDGPSSHCGICLDANLARAFDAADMADSTIVMLEKYLATPYWGRHWADRDGRHLAVTYYRLGELYEGKGEKQKAYGNYAKFVELWKDADAEFQPKVQEARRRLERLKDIER